MKYLITGGSGFIGTHLIRHLLQKGDVSILNLDIDECEISDTRLQSIQVDIKDINALYSIKPSTKFDICIHLAALCKEPGYEWEDYFRTNHLGTNNIIRLCAKLNVEKFFFTSTMMVYQAGEVKRTEDSITAPDTAYGISKLLAEKELIAWKKEDDKRKAVIIRPAVVFGEGENANFTRLYKSLKKGFFPFVGKSSTIKSSIYVKELINFIDFLIEKDLTIDIYNMGFPENQSIRRIVSTFKQVFNFKSINPILPYGLLILGSYFFEFLNTLGLKNSIHHRRIQKLYFSTDIYPSNALKEGYTFRFDFESSLLDWKDSKDSNLD
ncbi:MAG: NAD(P)-dependent oxidoreductase [Cyclobacteriaceae bacterium]